MALVTLVTLAIPAHAADPTKVWRTLESPHFIVHFYEPHEDVARRVAAVAERAHRELVPLLRHAPREKTHVVVNDDVDYANGFASVVPRNLIGLYMTAPEALGVLNDHEDWLYGLVLHEYVHILHLDTIHGLPRLYNRIFGKTWAPNNIQPAWFIEGLATFEESRRTASGRLRNAIFDMYLRVAVLAGDPLRLDEVSSDPLEWPQATARYLYGSTFLRFVADRYGEDRLAEVSHAYGREPIPWGVNKAIERVVGKSYQRLYREWLEHLRRRYELQRFAVERRGRREGRQLTDSGQGNGEVRFAPGDAELVWRRADGRSRARYRVMPVGGDARRSRDLAVIDGAGPFSFLPDGSGLVLERGAAYRTFYSYSDLYLYDLASREVTRLTWGARVASPDVSPDGKRIACVLNGGSRRTLAVLPLAPGARPEVVWEGGRWDQAFDPSWSPDGRRLAFSAWTHGGYHDVYVLDLETRAVTRLTHDRAIDVTPAWSRDGRTVYFSSDRSGIYNVYAHDLATAELFQVTNVLGGAFAFDLSSDDERLVYQGYDDDGFELFELANDRARWLPAEPYVDDRPDPVRIAEDEEPPIVGPRPYRPIETLAPESYSLRLAADSFGSAVTVATGGSDVVGHHGWVLGATYGFGRGDVAFGGAYSLRRFWPSFRLGFGRSVGRQGGLIVDRRDVGYVGERWNASLAVGLPVLRRPETFSDVSMSYDMGYLRSVSDPLVPDPAMPVPITPELGRTASVTLRWHMSNVRRHVFTLGPNEGRGVSLLVRAAHPSIGSRFHEVEAHARWDEFLELPWGEHILATTLSAGIVDTDRRVGGRYYLGGVPEQDIVDSILNTRHYGRSGYLRGYRPGAVSGRQIHLANLEYRVPVRILERGFSTLPFYVRRLHVAGLFDVGNATNLGFDAGELRMAAGAAVRLDVVLGYYVGASFDVGYARGLTHDGQGEVWLLLTDAL